MQRVQIIIPSCKTIEQVQNQVDDIYKTRKTIGNIIPTCQPVSAAKNRNIGISFCDRPNDICIQTDDDMNNFFDGWDELLIQPFINDPNVFIVSARLMQPDGKLAQNAGDNFDLSKDYVETYRVPTSCIAFIPSKCPKFCEDYIGSGFEDSHFCEQIKKDNPNAKFLINNLVKLTHLNEQKNQSGKYWEYNKNIFFNIWGHY